MRPALDVFGTVAAATERKLASMLGDGPDDRERLRDVVAACAPASASEVERAVAFAESLSSKSSDHPNLAAYMSHPLRIATYCLRLSETPSIESAIVGVLHNVYEVCGLDEGAIERAGFGARVAAAIRLLTIDRKHETDPAYLTKFYGAIEAFGPDLALVRVVDKLDNLLSLPLLPPGPIYDSYLELAARFVGPLAHRQSADLGAYFDEVATFMRSAPFEPALKARYDALLGGS